MNFNAFNVDSDFHPGLFVLIGIVVFIGAVTEEASNSNKSRPSADEQMKVFHYRYGPSFILTIFSFISSESTGVLSVYLYISLYQLAYRKDRDHLEIPVDVNSEALAQAPGDQQLELENYRSLNTHLKNPLLSGHIYPDEEDDFSAEGVSPLVDSMGSDAALLDERGNRTGVGNSICSPTSAQRDLKNIQFLKRQGWKFKSKATTTALSSDSDARKIHGTDTSEGYPDHFEQFHYCQQQPKSAHQSKSVGNTTNASALTLAARSAATGHVPATLKHPTTDNLQSILHQSQQYTSQPLQPIQRRFQLLRQDSLHKQKPSKSSTKQLQQKAQLKLQQQLYNRHDWLTNSPSPTTLYKDTATQYSPLLSQAYNSFKTFDPASFRGKGIDKMSPERRRREEIHLRDVKTREEGTKLVEKRDLNANQLDKCQQRNPNNRPCCCQFQPHQQRRQQQNPGLYRLVSSSSKQLDINRSSRNNVTQPEEISLVETGFMARSAHYLPQCGLMEDWKESSVDRARSMHELRYFSYCNPQHLKSLVKPLLDDDPNFYFGRTTPVWIWFYLFYWLFLMKTIFNLQNCPNHLVAQKTLIKYYYNNSLRSPTHFTRSSYKQFSFARQC